jgi:hypothetical protein
MAHGLAVKDGTKTVHKLLNNGLASLSGSVEITGSITPDADSSREFGSNDKRWQDIYAVQTTVGAIFEYGLETKGIGQLATGTVVCWRSGKLVPCEKQMDTLVMGVTQEGKDQPIILGAEYILVTGDVHEGDFLVTSDKNGHAMSANLNGQPETTLFGKTIGQALESVKGDSNLIKCMINKR